ncbi:MAG: phosphate signaling complex protein PhoU [Planctomycetota bacterium]|nr:phosphate signaling complex protein PhoU [Planctomycetota bacterium]
MEKHFDKEMSLLKERILYMAALVEKQINFACRILLERNDSLVDEVKHLEEQVNRLQLEIDDTTVGLIALHQPVAHDLRFLVAAVKVVAELERVGDHAFNIARFALSVISQQQIEPMIDIKAMAAVAQKMLRESLDAFVNNDPVLAKTVLLEDDKADAYRDKIYSEIITYMKENPSSVPVGVPLLMISRNLERISDNATNIAEEVIFIVKGKDVRHHALDEK